MADPTARVERVRQRLGALDPLRAADRVPAHVPSLPDRRDRHDGRPLADENRKKVRAYRLSQAIWAGLAEMPLRKLEMPEVDPELSFVLLPKR